MEAAAGAMSAQRAALDAAARNLAAEEAAGPKGTYERQTPIFRVVDAGGTAQVKVVGMRRERGRDADAMTEMLAVMQATRTYESDAALFDADKHLVQQTIRMGQL